MKKILFTLLFCAIAITASAKKEYLCFYFQNNNAVSVSYGDMTSHETLKDKDGKAIKAYSPSYILNYFAKDGWVFVGIAGSQFLMEREVKEE